MSWEQNNAGWDKQQQEQTVEEMSWDVTLTGEDDSIPSKPVLPEGDYKFTITTLKRGVYNGSSKLPKCNKMDIKFMFEHEGEKIEIEETFFICKKMIWKLATLTRAIGLRKKNETMSVDWNKFSGSTGTAHIIINKFTKHDGSQGESNRIDNFIIPDKNKEEGTPF